jgi:Tol biopolymer transport system component
MTSNDMFGRDLSRWLHEEGEHRVPDHLAEVLVKTVATRQRPWWSSLERWLPMVTTLRARSGPVPNLGLLFLLGAIVIAVVGLLVFTIGSRPSLPEPFGLARNGTWLSSRDGDIYVVDPTSAEPQPLIADAGGFDFSPIFARDGTKFVFLRSDSPLGEPAMLTMMVADADGSNLRPITPPTQSLDWFDWSPDGSRIAYMAAGQLYVVGLGGDDPVRLEGTGRAHFPTWLPPAGAEIIFRRETVAPAIMGIRPDGSGLRTISIAPATNRYDYQGLSVSPDGTRIAFTSWAPSGVPRVYAMDVATGVATIFATPVGTGQRGSVVYSPDGSLVTYSRILRQGAYQVVVAKADGSDAGRVLGPTLPGSPDGSDAEVTKAFTPDGTALLVRYGTDEDADIHRLALDGSSDTIVESGSFGFIDIQRLAP